MSRPPNRPRASRPSIEDVAAAAGVSVATVSRALRDLPNVAAATRQRVRDAAEQLDYQADPAAARLATGRSQTVAIIVPYLNGWYFSHVVAGAEAVCAEAGYDVIVMGVGAATRDADVAKATKGLHRRADAAIFVDVRVGDAELDALDRQSLAVVSVGREMQDAPSIGIDDVEVGRLATQHLLALGHRRIGMIHGPEQDPFRFVVPQQRQRGYELALADAGIALDPSIQAPGTFTVDGGTAAFDRVMGGDGPPTAIFAVTDETAFGVILAARTRGIRIPEDVSLIGVDDHDLSAVVGLTTVHQDVAAHGARAARAAVAMLEGEDAPTGRQNQPVELVVRHTTAPPAPL
ncbi:MAG: LacI family DNA-binding transcriptional regulator [Ilumatobacter sp.]|nr:LacI family DNA-binding transcriptional regulator [Ilumatobacter sp.]